MKARKSNSNTKQSRLSFQAQKPVAEPENYQVKKSLYSKTSVDEDQQAKLRAQQIEILNSDPRYARLLESQTHGTVAFHQEEFTVIDKVLRQFDLNTSYGPCAGLSRIDRWKRAQRLGQEPPEEVYDILNSPIGGLEQYKYSYLGAYP